MQGTLLILIQWVVVWTYTLQANNENDINETDIPW